MKRRFGSKAHSVKKQISYRDDAVRFFEWCRFSLNHYVEKLDAASKKEFESGMLPANLCKIVRTAWSENLKSHLPWNEHFAVIRKVLTNPADYDAWMNCSMHLLQSLPKRIRTAVANGEKKRAKEIHDAFFAKDGETRLAEYLRVAQSRERARNKQIIQALGWKCKEGGGARLGNTEIDFEQRLLTEAAATGSAMKVRGIFLFIENLWKTDKTVIVKTAQGLEHRLIPNPDKSEARLNRFLIKLGRALSSTQKRRQLPDWLHGVDQTERFIVEGWCENITVDGETWPMLCFFTTPALVKFLRLCNVKDCKLARKDARTIERAIQRLGLVRIPRGRVKYVERRGGKFYFT